MELNDFERIVAALGGLIIALTGLGAAVLPHLRQRAQSMDAKRTGKEDERARLTAEAWATSERYKLERNEARDESLQWQHRHSALSQLFERLRNDTLRAVSEALIRLERDGEMQRVVDLLTALKKKVERMGVKTETEEES